MRVTIRTEILKPFVVSVLVAALILTSCKPKATHLSQSLENSGVPGQNSTQADEGSTQADGQGTAAAQASTSVNEPAATSIEPVITQGSSGTLPPVQTPISPVMILSPTATRKSATTQAATQTSSPLVSPTNTSTPTKTPTPTATTALTPSPTIQTGWAGEWTAYLVQADGSVLSGILTLTLAGDKVNGEFDVQGSLMNLEGDFLGAGGEVSGSYTGFPGNGFFKWLISEGGTFAGNLDNQRAFCGARAGLAQPDPCGYFDPE